MIKVGVGKNNRIQRTWRERQGLPISLSNLPVALEQSAIDKNPEAAAFNQIFRPGDRASGSQKR